MISEFVQLFYHPSATLDTSHRRRNIIKIKNTKQKVNNIT